MPMSIVSIDARVSWSIFSYLEWIMGQIVVGYPWLVEHAL